LAAPRKYSDAQREAIYRLHEQGLSSAAIARRCDEGLASVEPFAIATRTIRDITRAMDLERGHRAPRTVADASAENAIVGYGERALAICEAELDRLQRKQHRGNGLTRDDLSRLREVLRIRSDLDQVQESGRAPSLRRPRGERRRADRTKGPTLLARLASPEGASGSVRNGAAGAAKDDPSGFVDTREQVRSQVPPAKVPRT
jgi:hypothetical protein